MSDWLARAALGLIAVLLVGLIGGYAIADFATGRSLHHVHYGYEMPEDGAGNRSAAVNSRQASLDRIAAKAEPANAFRY